MKIFISKLYAFLKRDYLIALSYKFQFFISIVAIFISVYIFFFVSKFFETSNIYLQDYSNDYFFFLLTGFCLMDMVLRISITMNTEIRNYQLTGVFEELINLPTPLLNVLLYSHIYPFIMSLFRSTLFFLFAIIFFDLVINFEYIIFILLAMILTILSFVGIGMIAGAYALVFKKGNPISSLNRYATLIVGGIFFPTSVLPPWLDYISNLLPIKHGLEIIRNLMMPQAMLNNEIFYKFLLLILLTTIFLLVGYSLCNFALKLGKKRGTLSFY